MTAATHRRRRDVPPVVLGVSGSDDSDNMRCYSAPTRIISYSPRSRRGPPPCLRCGDNFNVVRWVASGTWFCRSAGCGHTWSTHHPPPRHPKPLSNIATSLATPARLRRRQRCITTPLELEVHFGRVGYACSVCERFYPVGSAAGTPRMIDSNSSDDDNDASTSSTVVTEC